MLVELSVVEHRYLAVREALDTGATITDIARRYGVDRRRLGEEPLRIRDQNARPAVSLAPSVPPSHGTDRRHLRVLCA